MAYMNGRAFRKALQEEFRGNGRRISCASDVARSETVRMFCEQALALDENRRRIPGVTPQIDFGRDFSIRNLAENLIVDRQTGEAVGSSFIERWYSDPEAMAELRESGAMNAIDYSMFSGVTGQLMINSILQGFAQEEYVLSNFTKTYSTKLVSGERIPGISPPMDPDKKATGVEDVLLHKPGAEFKYFGFGEEYVDLPETRNYGGIIPVDRLSLYSDRTGLIAQYAADVGKTLGLNKEKRGLLTLIGLDGYQFTEKRLGDSGPVKIDPYQYASATAGAGQLVFAYKDRKFPFSNDIPSNFIEDYKAIETADNAFAKVPNPNTGEPIEIGGTQFFIPYSQRIRLAQILQATNVWKISQASDTNPFVNGAINTVSPNPLNILGAFNVKYSRQFDIQLADALKRASSTANPERIWFYGNIAEAIQYAENWPIKVIQAPSNSEAEFRQDIVMRFRADECGRWVWWNPRAVQRHNFQVQN